MGFLSPGAKQTVRNNEVSVLRGGGGSVKRGLTVELLLACLLAPFQPRGTQVRFPNSGSRAY